VPAVIALFLYSQLPIISNTYAAFRSIDPALREAAHGMGMTRLQRLRFVEAPMVIPVIMAGCAPRSCSISALPRSLPISVPAGWVC
jgi:osmoprotectant transport system permease protein